MCLILVAWQVHRRYPLVVAANRDEFHERAAAPAAFWEDTPGVLAGRDLQARGAWLGASRSGKFAAVTNYRGGKEASAIESRGALVSRFLANGDSPAGYVEQVAMNQQRYSGFNLLLADREELWWMSNRDSSPRRLAAGCHALGNLLLDTPEVMDIREKFSRTPVAAEPLFALLKEARIVAPVYGTRCSSVLLAGADGRIQFAERPFDAAGAEGTTVRYEFGIAAPALATA
jgi:uncharacterized protein with NRDE domain